MSAPGERPAKPILSDAARDRLIESRLTPNAISMVGLLGNLLAVWFIFEGWWIAAGAAFVAGSVMDLLDGKYSRMSGKATLFGAFLDSSLDRIEEGFVLAAIAWQFAEHGDSTVTHDVGPIGTFPGVSGCSIEVLRLVIPVTPGRR